MKLLWTQTSVPELQGLGWRERWRIGWRANSELWQNEPRIWLLALGFGIIVAIGTVIADHFDLTYPNRAFVVGGVGAIAGFAMEQFRTKLFMPFLQEAIDEYTASAKSSSDDVSTESRNGLMQKPFGE